MFYFSTHVTTVSTWFIAASFAWMATRNIFGCTHFATFTFRLEAKSVIAMSTSLIYENHTLFANYISLTLETFLLYLVTTFEEYDITFLSTQMIVNTGTHFMT